MEMELGDGIIDSLQADLFEIATAAHPLNP
jgi:hypothetical protein